MSKLFIFDFDGVLVDTCDSHAELFRRALREVTGLELSEEDHDFLYNGLSTRMKLAKFDVLTEEARENVYQRKQELTRELLLEKCGYSVDLFQLMATLKAVDYKLACASNCIRATVETALKGLGIYHLFDMVVSNEDVTHPKPDPEMYIKIMEELDVSPEDTTIFEDSYVGLTAAIKSGAKVHRVRSPNDLKVLYVLGARPNITQHVNIVIPMAGNGSRFAKAGYKDPKPLIPVFGQPMISWVVKNLGVEAKYTFLIRKDFEHAREYLNELVPGCNVITIDKVTEGAACTVLLAKEQIDNDDPLLIINSDQYIEFEGCENAFQFIFDFLYKPSEAHLDGKISTFDGQGHPKWSYAKLNKDGLVEEVREKDPFSDHATTGLYMWKRGSDFVKYANQMISKNIRVNNEFYVVPVFNEAIADGSQICISDCKKMWGLGVPEDLEYFVNNFHA